MQNFRPKFALSHVIFFAIAFGLWRLGVFDNVPNLTYIEYILSAILGIYGLVGVTFIFRNKIDTAKHIANGIPMWALCFTVLGMLSAVGNITSLTPENMIGIFKNLAYAITPNMVGMVCLAWIRELAWWVGHEEI